MALEEFIYVEYIHTHISRKAENIFDCRRKKHKVRHRKNEFGYKENGKKNNKI